jgi:transposase
MRVTLSEQERAELVAVQRASRNVRHWRRYQAVLLRGEGMALAIVAQTLGCTQASVCNWTRAWRERGARGVAEGTHPGAERRLDTAAERVLEGLLEAGDPQAHGQAATNWTAPLLRTELAQQGWRASERTVRRTLHRLGYHWKRPKFVLGRPDPAYAEKKAVAEQAAAVAAAGGQVWFGDETAVREFPPLRACWAKRGHQQEVIISGRNGRRVIHGALNAASGDFVALIRERSRQDDCLAFVEALAQICPDTPKLLVWDNAPPHHPKRVLEAAERAHITIAWLPFRAPELMPCEDLWRLSKAQVAANRPYREEQPDVLVQRLAEQAVHSIDALSSLDRLRCSGLLSSKFQWLST